MHDCEVILRDSRFNIKALYHHAKCARRLGDVVQALRGIFTLLFMYFSYSTNVIPLDLNLLCEYLPGRVEIMQFRAEILRDLDLNSMD